MESVIKETPLGLNRGGEVGRALIALNGLTFTCTCGHRITMSDSSAFSDDGEFLGYRHSGGIKDKFGITWWMYLRCPKCHYDWALWKVRQNIKKH